MGIINKVKGNAAGKEAAAAFARGDTVLPYKIIEASATSRTTAPMTGVAEQIQAIEAEGWVMAHMAAAESKTLGGERIALVCLFRRI